MVPISSYPEFKAVHSHLRDDPRGDLAVLPAERRAISKMCSNPCMILNLVARPGTVAARGLIRNSGYKSISSDHSSGRSPVSSLVGHRSLCATKLGHRHMGGVFDEKYE